MKEHQWMSVVMLMGMVFGFGIARNMGLFCNSPLLRRTSPVEPAETVLVPGGSFLMGSNQGFADERAVHQVNVAPFRLQKTGVTTSSYADYLAHLEANSAHKETYQAALPVNHSDACNYDSFQKRPKPGKENHPVNCITRQQAESYCKAMGMRLPTEVEREYVAKGPQGSEYPWGNEDPSDSNTCWSGRDYKRSGTCPVGSYPKTLLGHINPKGVSDLAGNLWEWTSSGYAAYPEHKDCQEGMDCVLRGGSWNNFFPVFFSTSYRLKGLPDYWIDAVGFRCALTE